MAIDTAVILCGGKGTRFRQSAEAELEAQRSLEKFKPCPPAKTRLSVEVLEELRNTPKCLVNVFGKPLIWHKIEQLAQAGVHHVILCAGRHTSITKGRLADLSWKHPVSVSMCPEGFFRSHDLGDVLRAVKGRPADSSVILTAGDCLTTTDYTRLATEHMNRGGWLTVATSHAHGHETFVQDSVARLAFLHQAQRETAYNQSCFPFCSPLVAAIFRAWHKHTLSTLPGVTDYLNINTVLDFSQLLSEPTRFLPPSNLGHPYLQELSPRERSYNVGMQR